MAKSKRRIKRRPGKGGEADGAPRIGPVTHAALYSSSGRDAPPAIIEEWEAALKHPGDFILLWAGANRIRGESGTLGWSSLFVGVGDRPPPGPPEPPDDPDMPSKVERMLSPLAHESRVRILQALMVSPLSSSALSEATGLRGGNLYHHLKELLHSSYVCEKDGAYALTSLGRQLALTLTCLASKVVQDRGDEGLVVGQDW